MDFENKSSNFRTKENKYPTEKECNIIFDKHNVPDNIRKHGKAVANLCLTWVSILEVYEIYLDKELLYAAAYLHDIGRLERNHSMVGSRWVMESGYPEVADIIRKHHKIEDEDIEMLSEISLLFLADKLIQEDKLIGLEKRFSHSYKKCKTPEAVRNHDNQWIKALKIKGKLDNLIGADFILN